MSVEPYWAEPGVGAVVQLRQLIDDGEPPQAALQLLGGLSNLPLASAGETVAVRAGRLWTRTLLTSPSRLSGRALRWWWLTPLTPPTKPKH